MRMSSFLMGGLVGAAAVMYFSKKNRPMMFSSINQAAEKAGRFMNTSRTNSDRVSNKSASGESDSQVKKMIDSDPEIKHTVDEILSNNQTENSYQ